MQSSTWPRFPQTRQVPEVESPRIRKAVLHVSGYLGRAGMGLSTAALGLAHAQRECGWETEMWSCDGPAAAEQVRIENDLPPGSMKTFSIVGPSRLCFTPAMMHAARKSNGCGVVHQHGLWQATSMTVQTLRNRHGVPVVLAPHGSLDSYALRKSRTKKWLASVLYESDSLHGATCLHALAEPEIAAIRDYGLRNPIALIPNGISQKWLSTTGDGNRFREAYSLPSDKRILLFLGRITPKKGLPLFLRAFARARIEEWMIVIAGTDEFNHQDEIVKMARELGISRSVTFVGALSGQTKRDAFAACDFFFLTSYSEGLPMAVLEALGAGVPVLATSAIPLEAITRIGCGWRVEPTESAITETLSEIGHCSKQRLSACGQTGRAYFSKEYSWASSAQKTIQLYRWLQRTGDRPDFVVTD
jgi:glycosyltransferase involved in cell wall biosynthesis